MNQRQRHAGEQNTTSFVAVLTSFAVLCHFDGFAVAKAVNGEAIFGLVAGASNLLTIALLVLLVSEAGFVFGSPEIPVGIVVPGLLVSIMLSFLTLWMMFLGCYGQVCATCLALSMIAILRGAALFPWLFLTLATCSPSFMRFVYSPSDGDIGALYATCLGQSWSAITIAACMFMPYVRDQRFACVLSCIPNSAYGAGGALASGHSDSAELFIALYQIMVSIVLGVYGSTLVKRSERVIPFALRNCRFVRLGYLRKMLATGRKIQRCQELPAEAFGDFRKASLVIITSHRWLNRFTCDLATEEYPTGFRLKTMLRRIGLSFPETVLESKDLGLFSFGYMASLLSSLTLGGSDILVFFDFMGLPQIGQTSDGTQIPRTEKESIEFFEALSSMGALYTMYPVLVIPEVTPEVPPYFASGWCSSEFYSALLSKNLSRFSLEAIREYEDWLDTATAVMSRATLEALTSGTLSATSVIEFSDVFSSELSNKLFFNEDDRPIVEGIVKGYLLKRLLSDAIANQQIADVQKYLFELKNERLEHILDHAVDDSLDTLLHSAVRLPSIEIVNALLEAGADPHVRNVRGDTPSQFFMWPRLSATSQFCRTWQSDLPHYHTLSL